MSDAPQQSLVIPVYNEETHIASSIATVRRILDEAGISHQFILVDDGSRDQTWPALQSMAAALPHIRAFKLSRNFGKEAALCAGLEQVDTELALIMDSAFAASNTIRPTPAPGPAGNPLVSGVTFFSACISKIGKSNCSRSEPLSMFSAIFDEISFC